MDTRLLVNVIVSALTAFHQANHTDAEISPTAQREIEDKVAIHLENAGSEFFRSAKEVHEYYQAQVSEAGNTIPEWEDLLGVERLASHLIFGAVRGFLGQSTEETGTVAKEVKEELESADESDSFLKDQSN